MPRQQAPGDDDFDRLVQGERARLVRLCARFSGDVEVAEDLAQEALAEAWRSRDRLREPDRSASWLSGIARNVCLRWRRRTYRDRRWVEETRTEDQAPEADRTHMLADDFDVEIELERGELARLLDRALSLLSPETRALLTQRYIEEIPQAEVAARLGLTEPAVAMRIQRGKLALRTVLATDLRADADSYGLPTDFKGQWERTRIWCCVCGSERMLGRFTEDRAELWLRCPACCADSDDAMLRTESFRPAGFKGVRSYTSAYAEMYPVVSAFYRRAFQERVVPCVMCGQQARVTPGLTGDIVPFLTFRHYFRMECDGCGSLSESPLHGATALLPEGWTFWQTQRKIRMLPERELEVEGQPAVVTSLQSLTSPDRFDVIYARDSFRLLGLFPPSGMVTAPSFHV